MSCIPRLVSLIPRLVSLIPTLVSLIPRPVSLIPRLSEPSSYYIIKNEHWSVKAALLSGSVRMLQVLYSMCVTNDTIVQNVFLTSFAAEEVGHG